MHIITTCAVVCTGGKTTRGALGNVRWLQAKHRSFLAPFSAPDSRTQLSIAETAQVRHKYHSKLACCTVTRIYAYTACITITGRTMSSAITKTGQPVDGSPIPFSRLCSCSNLKFEELPTLTSPPCSPSTHYSIILPLPKFANTHTPLARAVARARSCSCSLSAQQRA